MLQISKNTSIQEGVTKVKNTCKKNQNFSTKKGKHDQYYLLFLNKASLLYACLETKILWSRQGGTLKFKNPNTSAEPRINHQSTLSALTFLSTGLKQTNSHAKIVSLSLLISSHLFSRLVKNYYFPKLFSNIFSCQFLLKY